MGGDGIWRRDAVYGEIYSLDNCLGHQPPTGEYHYHAKPVCLRATSDPAYIQVTVYLRKDNHAEARKLGIDRELPVGKSVLIEIAPQPAKELAFLCGMGMYRGVLVVR